MAHEHDIIEEFRRAMAEQGIVTDDDIVADGKLHRFHVSGDRKKSRNGWMVLHIDGKPSGAFGSNKLYGNTQKFTWSSNKKTTPMSPAERAAFRERVARQKAEREARRRAEQESAACHARFMWDRAQPCEGDDHPYLQRKGVKSHGLRVGAWEKLDHENGEVNVVSTQALLIPIRDIKKNIHSLQAIFTGKALGDRDKDFVTNGAKSGLFYSIGKPVDADVGGEIRKIIMIGEGYATCASAHEATGHAAIVAFDAGNLLPVAGVIRERFPTAHIVILADNDQWTLTPIKNPGVHHAKAAAAAVGGVVAIPPFAHDNPSKPTDFNDLCQQIGGAQAVAAVINAAIHGVATTVPDPEQPADDDDDQPQGPASNAYIGVLGYNRGTYYILQHGKQQIAEVTKSDFASDAGLIALAPLHFWEEHFPGGRGGIDHRSATEFLIRTAERRGIFDPSRIRGCGAWMDDGRVVYHHGSHLTVDGESTPVTRIRSRYVYELEKSMPAPDDMPLSDADGQRVVDVIKMFRWSMGGAAMLFSGWIALAPVCGAIPWRPHLWLTGGAGSGKSSLAKFAHSLLKGTDVFANGNSTEAGIRQRLRSDARPVLMDESESNEEKDAHRIQQVLGLIRQASTESDAETLKGTTDGAGMTYHIRSMFCLASIQVALKHKADIDRLTVLTLKSAPAVDPTAGKEWSHIRESMYQISTHDRTIRGRLLRRAINRLPVTLQDIETFSSVGAEVFGSQRDGDQYGALMAGAWSLISMEPATREQARSIYDAHNWGEIRDDSDSDESQRALSALMSALIRIKGLDVSVYELIKCASGLATGIAEINEVTADATLQRHGMKLQGGHLVLANGSVELKRLMQDTPFAADWRGVLLRVPGADKNDNKPARFQGVLSKCIRIPVAPILAADKAAEGAF